ncbi:MAG: putative Actinobacterial Holin-X, holin superfamily, partial [Actinomycetota bacterium]
MTSPIDDQTEVTPKRFGELVAQSIADIQTLIRNQIDLAVAELKESGRRALRSSIFLITALMFFLVSGLLFIIAIAYGLAEFGIPTWLAFVIDAGLFMLIGVILLFLA